MSTYKSCHLVVRMEGLRLCGEEPGLERPVRWASICRDALTALDGMRSPRRMERRRMRRSQGHGDAALGAENGIVGREGAARIIVQGSQGGWNFRKAVCSPPKAVMWQSPKKHQQSRETECTEVRDKQCSHRKMSSSRLPWRCLMVTSL